ncbi:MAG: acyl-CoA synthetase, partial [Burkholderiaceae bacterium]|nr:acyl-CoA synthetase [Burkholderiaceae bacterium]
ALEAEAAQGRGALLLGAHVGSFEVISACRQQVNLPERLRLAMLMFPDNARRINAMLDAIAKPECRPHIIALGRPGSMLHLRDWLDAGGMAGLLADRTLPGTQGRAQRHGELRIDFLGHPAVFHDSPFRLAAALRRRVFFMAGIYLGGARYEVHFEPLADFSALPADAAGREPYIRAAVQAYVARLEALCRADPYNWFNFHDFWLEDGT